MNVYSKHDIVKCKYLLQWKMCLQSCSYTNPCNCDKASYDVTDSVTSCPSAGGRAQPTPLSQSQSTKHKLPSHISMAVLLYFKVYAYSAGSRNQFSSK